MTVTALCLAALVAVTVAASAAEPMFGTPQGEVLALSERLGPWSADEKGAQAWLPKPEEPEKRLAIVQSGYYPMYVCSMEWGACVCEPTL
jgi:hypothetical protein